MWVKEVWTIIENIPLGIGSTLNVIWAKWLTVSACRASVGHSRGVWENSHREMFLSENVFT